MQFPKNKINLGNSKNLGFPTNNKHQNVANKHVKHEARFTVLDKILKISLENNR